MVKVLMWGDYLFSDNISSADKSTLRIISYASSICNDWFIFCEMWSIDAASTSKNVLSTPCNLAYTNMWKQWGTILQTCERGIYMCRVVLYIFFKIVFASIVHTCWMWSWSRCAACCSVKKAPLPAMSGALGGFLGKFSTFTVLMCWAS